MTFTDEELDRKRQEIVVQTELIVQLADRLESALAALKFISEPAMGRNGRQIDAVRFAGKGATDEAVRVALGLSIKIARQALKDVGGPAYRTH